MRMAKLFIVKYQSGAETQEIFEAIPEAGNDYASAMKKLDTFPFIREKSQEGIK